MTIEYDQLMAFALFCTRPEIKELVRRVGEGRPDELATYEKAYIRDELGLATWARATLNETYNNYHWFTMFHAAGKEAALTLDDWYNDAYTW
jgi:peptidoglycan/xylan/chitin deacetylase (PgdA/CDA1 family)